MIQYLKSLTSRFCKEEKGAASVEFVLYFTVMFTIMAASVEIAYINLRHAMLERSVDLATRDIRLATGAVPDYATVKANVCEKATVLEDCEANLRLEMVQVDPRDLSTAPTDADCQNMEEEPSPVRSFTPGTDNDLMLLRACLKYKPLIPTSKFSSQLTFDTEGYAQMIVTSAFVQEPR